MALIVSATFAAPLAGAVHFYRGPGQGCTPADGDLTDTPAQGPLGATVLMLHNSFNDLLTGTPVTIIKAGQSVKWTWNSEHCHSTWSLGNFYSGFHYPSDTPTTPEVLPGLFHYPVPTLAPTLAFTHTFGTPGNFLYFCEHHQLIGMQGVVVVQAA